MAFGLKSKIAAGAVALAVSIVGTFEGLRLNTYKDVIGVPTVCYGETRGVKDGQRFTKEACNEMLAERLVEFNAVVSECVTAPTPEHRRAALLSFVYNVGQGTFCRSSVVRLLNNGDVKGGCDALLLYVKAGGRTLRGLENRRKAEREFCLRED